MPDSDDVLVAAGVARVEEVTVRLGAIAVADVPRLTAGFARSEDHSPVLLLPRADPVVAAFLAELSGLPTVFLGYLPRAAVEGA